MASNHEFRPPSERLLIAIAMLWGVLTVLVFEEAFGHGAERSFDLEMSHHAKKDSL